MNFNRVLVKVQPKSCMEETKVNDNTSAFIVLEYDEIAVLFNDWLMCSVDDFTLRIRDMMSAVSWFSVLLYWLYS